MTAGVPIQLIPGPWQVMQPLVKPVWFIGGTALAITKLVNVLAEWQLVQAVVPGVACATCHGSGMSWVGTPGTVLPPANHIPFGAAACESCHTPNTFTAFT
ncbi:MAG TPA: hypothetical protein VF931_07570, partial [Steroidobacteraceae bacterium]